ncbi:glucosamine-6-phosphate deaminase [Paenibacillus thermoaerophilus]|uniref:Glucosamine-6-phosphate deaminase n=1 Tax=Paenibacillus thermoaerophilus TaxID=1215385 RepID=A0ABW2VAC7_9BACL|nr:glucosamine-6-phosphate deaminase [Paenibacillus thermoaerophilus]TMV17941.1 glucosamine-6-phosphate deaminase [Paenibacillus thermoaerophilus]
MKIYIVPQEQIGKLGGELIARQLQAKPDSVLGLATGSTPIPFYKEWISLVKQGKISFARARSFNLDEYVGLPGGHPQSYRTFMRENLLDHIDLPASASDIPNGQAKDLEAECRRYDKALEDIGGIDWQLLGIGHNGHIGFNEPGPSLTAGTHVVELAEETREANSRFFASIDEVPTQAITVGMGTILKARQIVLVAQGESKAGIVAEALTGPVTTELPASFLQLHGSVTVVLDEAAASKLPASLIESAKGANPV